MYQVYNQCKKGEHNSNYETHTKNIFKCEAGELNY